MQEISPQLKFALAAGLFEAFRPHSEAQLDVLLEAKANLEDIKEDLDEYSINLLENTDIGETAEYEGKIVPLDYPMHAEAAEHNGKTVSLNKPTKNNSGSGKFKVYVKNPKTGNIKKITFGTSATKAIVGDPDRRKSFVARHRCERFAGMGPEKRLQKQYWACVATPRLVGVSARYW